MSTSGELLYDYRDNGVAVVEMQDVLVAKCDNEQPYNLQSTSQLQDHGFEARAHSSDPGTRQGWQARRLARRRKLREQEVKFAARNFFGHV
jgi:hypothetical protein